MEAEEGDAMSSDGGREDSTACVEAGRRESREGKGRGGKGVKLRDLPADGRIVEAAGWLVRGSRGRVQQATATLACLALYWTLHCLRKKDSATTPAYQGCRPCRRFQGPSMIASIIASKATVSP